MTHREIRSRRDGVLHDHDHDQESEPRGARRVIVDAGTDLRGRLQRIEGSASRLPDARFELVREFRARNGVLQVERCGGGLAVRYAARGDGPKSRVIIDWPIVADVLETLLAELERGPR